MAKVSVVASDQCDAIFPNQFPGVLRVTTTDGRRLVKEVLVNRGGPQRPLNFDELATKFSDNASRVLDPSGVAAIRAAVDHLESLPDVGAALRVDLSTDRKQ